MYKLSVGVLLLLASLSAQALDVKCNLRSVWSERTELTVKFRLVDDVKQFVLLSVSGNSSNSVVVNTILNKPYEYQIQPNESLIFQTQSPPHNWKFIIDRNTGYFSMQEIYRGETFFGRNSGGAIFYGKNCSPIDYGPKF